MASLCFNPLDPSPPKCAQGDSRPGPHTMDAKVVFGIQDVRPPSSVRPRHVRRRQTPQRHFGSRGRTYTDAVLKQAREHLRDLRKLKLLPEDEPSDDDLTSEEEDFALRGPPSLGLRRMLRTERRRMAPKAPAPSKQVGAEDDTAPLWWKDMKKTVEIRKALALDEREGTNRSSETVTTSESVQRNRTNSSEKATSSVSAQRVTNSETAASVEELEALHLWALNEIPSRTPCQQSLDPLESLLEQLLVRLGASSDSSISETVTSASA
jgi:hypothetical protein